MTSATTTSQAKGIGLERPGWLLRMLARRLSQAGVSALRLVLADGRQIVLGVERDDRHIPVVRLHRWRAILRGWQSGLMGWAEGYMAGDWDCEHIVELTDWAMSNEYQLESAFEGNRFSAAIHRAFHLLRDNSRRGSRRNIAYHYDLGNAFYELWLDAGMSYSSALYLDSSETLKQAQHNKYQRVLEMLGASADGRVLEIGCGWGGFAEELLRYRQGSIHGITLSAEQLDYTRQRLAAWDASRCDFNLTDYRDSEGEFDGIVSIEMFEAVGEAHWAEYFATLRRRLKPGGAAVLQVITIADDRFESYRQGTDFIQRYIFPGGMLPSPGRFREAVERGGLRLGEVQCFGQDYARTLRQWHLRFRQNWPQIEALGFDERFRRMWNYYLAYCESGFKSGAIDVQLCRIERD